MRKQLFRRACFNAIVICFWTFLFIRHGVWRSTKYRRNVENEFLQKVHRPCGTFQKKNSNKEIHRYERTQRKIIIRKTSKVQGNWIGRKERGGSHKPISPTQSDNKPRLVRHLFDTQKPTDSKLFGYRLSGCLESAARQVARLNWIASV